MSTENSLPPDRLSEQSDREGPLVIDGISYIPSSVLLSGIPKLSFKDDSAFGVVDPRGEAPRAYAESSELGIYFRDTRYLSTWDMTLNSSSLVALSHELRNGGTTLVFSMTNRDIIDTVSGERIPRETLLIRRILALTRDAFYETVVIRNFGIKAHGLQIEQWAASRFDDLFEVRGFPRERRGKMLAPEESTHEGAFVTTLQYRGLDGKTRRTHIHRLFETEKIRLSPDRTGCFSCLSVPPKGDAILRTIVSFDDKHDCRLGQRPFAKLSVPEIMAVLGDKEGLSPFATQFSIKCDNAIINRALDTAREDIQMLLTREEDVLYPYAGIPWYSAPFGRDGLITAYQMLPWYPELAKGVLDYVFRTLGKQDDPFTDEQPGKVFHEMRRGEMSNTREVPFIPYYGSVDSTPLALILLHEYISWSGDIESLKAWWPDALRALEWIERWGDSDGDGLLEYCKRSPTGLVNQGWKDSHDSIMNDDGRLAQAPIRLCEVQGYAYRARMSMAKLAVMIGQEELSTQLTRNARQLRSRFMDSFWNPSRQAVNLALDGHREPCSALSSNMGHCLWSRILPHDLAAQVTDHLMSDAMFNGYGIRTLADTEGAYNPMSYHNGSIWPHDNSIIMEGMRYYGHIGALEKLAVGMMEVLESSSDFRLPELFCGFRRRGNEPPIPYEVACKPQAWAAGSMYLLIKSMLGISMDPDQKHVVFRSPTLTEKIGSLEIKGLRGRDWEMDIGFKRAGSGAGSSAFVDVIRRTGNVRVLTIK